MSAIVEPLYNVGDRLEVRGVNLVFLDIKSLVMTGKYCCRLQLRRRVLKIHIGLAP